MSYSSIPRGPAVKKRLSMVILSFFTTPVLATSLDEIRGQLRGQKWPLTVDQGNLSPSFADMVGVLNQKSYDQQRWETRPEEAKSLQDFFHRGDVQTQMITALKSLLAQKIVMELPGLPKPFSVQLSQNPEDLVKKSLLELSDSEKTVFLWAWLGHWRSQLFAGRSLGETLALRQGCPDLQEWLSPEHLWIYVASPADWRSLMGAVGDPSQMDALGLTVHDPDLKKSLILLNSAEFKDLSQVLFVLLHEFHHVIQHRVAEAAGWDFYAQPLPVPLVNLLLEGGANYGALSFMEALGLRSIEELGEGYQFVSAARERYLQLWEGGQSPVLQVRRLGIQLLRILDERRSTPSTVAQFSPGQLRDQLETVFSLRGVDHLLWAAQLQPSVAQAPLNFLRASGLNLSSEEKDYRLAERALQLKASLRYVSAELESNSLLRELLCGDSPCAQFSEAELEQRATAHIKKDQILLALGLGAHSQALAQFARTHLGRELSPSDWTRELAAWNPKERDLWLRFLMVDYPWLGGKTLLAHLVETLLPKSVQQGGVDLEKLAAQLEIHSCTYAEVKTCSTSFAAPSLQGRAQVQIRVDGHGQMEILQSLLHELTHHLQFFLNHSEPEPSRGDAGFIIFSEGSAMWAAARVPEVIADRVLGALLRQHLLHRAELEWNRESPNQSAAAYLRSLSDYARGANLSEGPLQGLLFSAFVAPGSVNDEWVRTQVRRFFWP
jgi:hypothetical protein